MKIKKNPAKEIFYREYKKFSQDKFRNELRTNLNKTLAVMIPLRIFF